jgi:protein arginine kinase
LRESHLISSELERGGNADRLVFLGPGLNASVMINEEDHLRLTTLGGGFCLAEVYKRLKGLEEAMEAELELAYSDEFGYLTACPTNAGTGLRLSVMLHLPGLALAQKVEESLLGLGELGLVVRGAYGEHSENMGDLYQISNEVTLGKNEDDLMDLLESVVRQIVERELEMRQMLMSEAELRLQDTVCRAIGLLATARQMNTEEAVVLLSRARLGLGAAWGSSALSHAELSRLFFEIQPGHLQLLSHAEGAPQDRDRVRAELLRRKFAADPSRN